MVRQEIHPKSDLVQASAVESHSSFGVNTRGDRIVTKADSMSWGNPLSLITSVLVAIGPIADPRAKP